MNKSTPDEKERYYHPALNQLTEPDNNNPIANALILTAALAIGTLAIIGACVIARHIINW